MLFMVKSPCQQSYVADLMGVESTKRLGLFPFIGLVFLI